MAPPWPANPPGGSPAQIETIDLLRMILRALYGAPVPDEAKTEPRPAPPGPPP